MRGVLEQPRVYESAPSWFPGEVGDVAGQPHLVHPDETRSAITHGEDLNFWLVTEDLWARFSWNPRIVYREVVDYELAENVYGWALVRMEVPFTAHPKPTWDDLFAMEQDWEIAWAHETRHGDWRDLVLEGSRDALLSEPLTHRASGKSLRLDGGPAHILAMAYAATRAAAAGLPYPRIVLREDGGHAPSNLVEIETETETHELLEDLMVRIIHTENARNIIWTRLWAIESNLYDEHGGLDSTATEDEIKAAKRTALEQWWRATKPEKLDKDMAAEVVKQRELT